ncbi:MAG: FAD-binding protein, partial [Candidatus Dormibacteraeota bacterium]|nr:FAD-binding protein [Candidatus Dormibacteraeota bacterium]
MDPAARQRLVARLRDVVGHQYAFDDPYEMRLYQYDASPETALPDVVVLPANAEEVARVVKICSEERVPIVARSAASSLAG